MKAAPPGAEANPGPFRDGSGIPLYEKSAYLDAAKRSAHYFIGKCFL